MLLRVFLFLLLFLFNINSLVNALEVNLEYVGKIECISVKGKDFKSFEIFRKIGGEVYRFKKTNISSSYFNYKVFQKFGSGYCSLNDKLNIFLEKPVNGWVLLKILADVYNLQFLWDESYKLDNFPIWLKLRNLYFSNFLKILENKWKLQHKKEVFPVKFIANRKLLILGNFSFALQKNKGGKAACPNYSSYLDICDKRGCYRVGLNMETNGLNFKKIPKNCLGTEIHPICKNTKYQYIFIDNLNLPTFITLLEKIFNVNFIYSPQDLPQEATTNLHFVFRCFSLQNALQILTHTFHLYLVKIDKGIYRIYKSKHEYSLVLEEASKKISKIFYLKNIDANEFVNILSRLYGSKVLYSVDPMFNAVVVIANPEIIAEIQKKYKSYIRNQVENEELISKIYYVKFGDAKDIAPLLKNYLSDKGTYKVLEETNAIEVTDYPTNLAMIEKVFGRFLSQKPIKIKVTVKFVRINKSFARSLGLNWSFTYQGVGTAESVQSVTGQFNNNGASITANFLWRKISTLTFQISAAESIGLSKTLSSPSLVLLNDQQGTITSGVQIPYQSVDQNGNPKTELVSASLTLNVKPKLLPDGRILLNIQLSKDSPNTALSVNGQPAIDTFQINQNFVVANGETVIIGGVQEKKQDNGEAGVPLLKDIPLLGWLFKTKNWTKSDDELMVFITAEVVNQ